MTDQYMKDVLRVAVAQICQTIGYNATQSAPLELLQDVLDKFMREFTRDLRRQVEHYNRTEANMDDVTLTLNSINVNVSELLDYVNNVEPVPFATEIPKFPARKNSYLNFLKPGSKEVLTRPVHVHDHLPPMLPPEISQPLDPILPSTSNGLSTSDIKPNTENGATDGVARAHNSESGAGTSSASILDKNTLQSLFKPSSNFDDADRPTREVSSVVMTTGGYISPAVEGKMPEAIVPDIIDKLMGFDAPPPPTPPPPPPPLPAPAPPVSRPVSRSSNTTPAPMVDLIKTEESDKDKNLTQSSNKESKKSSTTKALDFNVTNRKIDVTSAEMSGKKDKLLNHNQLPNPINPTGTKPPKLNKKKQATLMQNSLSAGIHHNNPNNYANMLLKKAKKQKQPLLSGQPLSEKHTQEKPGKLDPAEKTQRKYIKMLQKMAKQGKIPAELLSAIMGSDKKSKILNPQILQVLPPGPERIQLEKLLKKYGKQRQKQIKQQMMMEAQKHKKSLMQTAPPPLVPLFTPIAPTKEALVKPPLVVDLEEQKPKIIEQKDANCALSPVKTGFMPSMAISPGQQPPHLVEAIINKNLKTPVMTDTLVLGDSATLTPVPLLTGDGKELKLSNEPDRSKLNIFKKISKQKTPKSSSPTPLPLRMPTGLSDTPIINLPSGTTITPAPGPGPALGTSTSVGRSLFPPLPDSGANNIINLDDIKDPPPSLNVPNQPPTDLSMLNRVFGEKPPGGEAADMANKPKKRGRKPGSKNSPKIPGAIPASLLKKNKKMKLDPKLFPTQMPIPPDIATAVGAGNLSFDNVAQFFNNPPINPMEWSQNKQLQQQMLIMAAAKERKEQKKKNKIMKQDILSNEKNMMMPMPTNMSMGVVPTNEEVQNINKKLMRMDTILKPAPSTSGGNELSVDTSLITGKKLPSPSLSQFPQTSTSPLKSPAGQAASKRLMQGMEAMAAAAAAGLGQPFMLPNRPAFPNLPSSMLSILPFPFTARPGLIPTPSLFPTPGLGAFQSNPKNPLLAGMFPFPNLKQQTSLDTSSQETSEDLSMGNKKKVADSLERNYCNVAPLVPEFLKLNTPELNKVSTELHGEHDLTKTPKSRNSLSIAAPQDNILKKIVEAHTSENSLSHSTKSMPSAPGGMSINTFEQLMKKNDSPIDLASLSKPMKRPPLTQDTGLDFSMNKKHHPTPGLKQPPITLNNEPIEVSDDSDEMSQPPPPPLKTPLPLPIVEPTPVPAPTPTITQPNINIDEIFVANAAANKPPPTLSLESDLSSKELKKLKKQVKKTSASITSTLINPEKPEGVSKLAGGADLIPLTSTGLAYSSKNIPFNSLTANANPTFTHKPPSEFNTTSSSVFDNVTITAAMPTSATLSASTNIFDMQKKRKEHKKIKKELKEGKIKKKKDKKDKSKSKEKAERYLQSQETSPSKEKLEPIGAETPPSINVVTDVAGGISGVDKVKDKDLIKKLKKEKKKEKQRSAMEETSTVIAQAPLQISTSSLPEVERKQKSSPSVVVNASSNNEVDSFVATAPSTATPSASVVPKLTLKLGSTQSPTPIDDLHKTSSSSSAATATATTHTVSKSPPRDNQREPSPELARISPLVTRPPKQKVNPGGDLITGPSSATNSLSTASAGPLDTFGDVSKPSSTSNINMIVPPPNPWLSGGTISASSVLLPHQLLQTTKHDMVTASGSSNQSTDVTKAHTSADRQSPLTLITETSRPSSYIDAEGNRVWICPACGKVDDGSPMIGCDGCDAWYHWVCVGIYVAPKDNEDWFCRVCITRKKGLHGSDKKRKRNKKK
ncbi:transcription initiation factor TFIID subunit 3 isoform X1 [Stomoxys calcitrans]|uniref:transcription initiation factor TFIID subunit 3 isoform X1 n=1 Tax=Stomoxys calcitrans TaxID=35570 RepID=UPI0027E3345F|nr:transcription initiation factor TFIID subunit 3 isoform X1 [Stomoxys calcitrans]